MVIISTDSPLEIGETYVDDVIMDKDGVKQIISYKVIRATEREEFLDYWKSTGTIIPPAYPHECFGYYEIQTD